MKNEKARSIVMMGRADLCTDFICQHVIQEYTVLSSVAEQSAADAFAKFTADGI